MEERFLSVELGPEAYESYRRRVPMIVPFLRFSGTPQVRADLKSQGFAETGSETAVSGPILRGTIMRCPAVSGALLGTWLIWVSDHCGNRYRDASVCNVSRGRAVTAIPLSHSSIASPGGTT